MRHSKKKGDQTPLPEQDVMGSENDFAPGGGDRAARGAVVTLRRIGGDATPLPPEAAPRARRVRVRRRAASIRMWRASGKGICGSRRGTTTNAKGAGKRG